MASTIRESIGTYFARWEEIIEEEIKIDRKDGKFRALSNSWILEIWLKHFDLKNTQMHPDGRRGVRLQFRILNRKNGTVSQISNTLPWVSGLSNRASYRMIRPQLDSIRTSWSK